MVNIPIGGLGGIVNASDAVEVLLAGASAVQIGTANFLDPTTPLKVANGIKEYMERHGFDSVDKLTGALIV